jgi:signal transduction histidine kinase
MSISNLLIKARKGEITDTYLDDKIRKITADIQRIRNVIEHVRLFSRDQIQNTPELIDIHQALRDAVSMIMYDLTKHQIKLRLHLSEIPLFSVGSKYKLEQVFLNLISNARDAIREKQEGSLGQEALIEISTLKVGEQAEIVFRDNGIGMSEAGIVKMFDPFYTTKSPDQGTGLGLSISYGIIREMNGQILVSSEPGVYTHVTIMIPNLEERK